MKTLVCMHIENEGPGTLGDYLLAENVPLRLCRLYDAEVLPEDPLEFDAIVSMGGPMNVYEEDEYPFLKEETLFLRRAIASGVPILGICLGAQMIAKACGSAVTRAPVSELGWARIQLTTAARTDPLFEGVSETLQVFQWHEDTFEIPAGGQRLATSQACRNQAFRYRNAYGLQFHVEVTREMLKEWFRDPDRQRPMVDSYEEHKAELSTNARTLYDNFLTQMRTRKAIRGS
jgi:GMP synthase (glutamine-hydrolysing)